MQVGGLVLRLDKTTYQVRFYHRIIFALILGLLSYIFGETLRGQYVYWFDKDAPIAIFFMYPMHLFHIIVLAWIVFKATDGKPTISSLFIAGSLFGMFEAYITKEIWAPTWSVDLILKLDGVALLQTAIMVFFFHNFFSFIIPLWLAESMLSNTESKIIFNCLPSRVRYIFEQRRNSCIVLLGFFVVWAGIYASRGQPFPKILFTAAILFILGVSIAVWRHLIKHKEVSLRDMLPQDMGFYFCVVGLIVFYIFGGLEIRVNYIPNWRNGQLFVWLIYFLLIIIFATNLLYDKYRDDRQYDEIPHTHVGETSAEEAVKLQFSWPLFILLCIIFVGIAAGFSFLTPWPQIFILATLIAGLILGGTIFLLALKHAYQGVRLLFVQKPWKDLE